MPKLTIRRPQGRLRRIPALTIAVVFLAALFGSILAAAPAQAINPCNEPDPAPRCVTPKPPPPIIGTPSGLHIVGGFGSTITLGWTDNSPNELGFQIDQWNASVAAPGGPYGLPKNMNQTYAIGAHPGTGPMTVTLTNLNPGGLYTFAIESRGVQSPYYANYTVSNFLTVPAFPTAPGLSFAAPTDHSLTLEVTDTASYALGFNVSEESWPWYLFGGHTWTQIGTVSLPSPGAEAGVTTAYTVGVPASTYECFLVATYNGAGLTDSLQECDSTLDAPPPPPPAAPVTNLRGTASGTSITWTWIGHPTDTSYDVQLADVTSLLGTSWPKGSAAANPGGVVSYTSSGLLPGHTYQLTVYAYAPGDAASPGTAATTTVPAQGTSTGVKSVDFYDCATTDRTVWLSANGTWQSVGTAHAPEAGESCGLGGETAAVTVNLPAGVDIIATTAVGDIEPAVDYKFWAVYLGNPSGPATWTAETDND